MTSSLTLAFSSTLKAVKFPLIVTAAMPEGKTSGKARQAASAPLLSPSAKAADKATEGAVSRAIREAGFKAEAGKTLVIRASQGTVILLGTGVALQLGTASEDIGGAIFKALAAAELTEAVLAFDEDDKQLAASLGYGAMLASYHFTAYRTHGKLAKPTGRKLTIASPSGRAAATAYNQLKAIAEGVFMARDLVYEPANTLFPEAFAKRCKDLGKLGVSVQILDEKQMQKLGMNLLLAVGNGSVRASRMVVMQWKGGSKTEKPLALIGKGVCFDTGGISLKPAGGMEDMKWDMGGAAAVTGAMRAIAGSKLKRNVTGIIGLVENMPDGAATRPGDVVTSMSGQTVEVINTDAEGRLVLADLITWCQQKIKPAAMIDLATLTGAIIVALGKEHAGLFSNNDGLATAITEAGLETGEKCWRMPLGKEYDTLLKSHIADMKNIGGRWAGPITAACFLERFVEETPWAHLDIAGMAWSDKARPTVPTGGTGFGVRLLTRLAEDWKPGKTDG